LWAVGLRLVQACEEKMKGVLPVKAFRYDSKKVGDLGQVLAPPYDVISPELQKELYDQHPANVVRMILGYQYDTDDENNNRYTRARDDFSKFLKDGVIVQDAEPGFYVYDQEFDLSGRGRVCRRGIIGRWRLTDEGGLLAHEKTLDGPKVDRFKLFRACKVVCSQVFSFYTDPAKKIDAVLSQPGVMEFAAEGTTPDGIKHILHIVRRQDAVDIISDVLSSSPQFIADGHHRYETTRNYRAARIAELGGSTGDEPFNFATVYMANTCQDGLVILPFNRMLHDVPGFSNERLLEALRADCVVTHIDKPVDQVDLAVEAMGKDGSLVFGLYLQGLGWHTVLVKPESRARFARDCGLHPAVAALDVSWIHQRMLLEMLGISLEAQAAKTNIDYHYDPVEIDAAVRANPARYQVGIIMNQVTAGQIEAVAQAGEKMPQKSTYFFPKIISGLVIHPLEEQVP
jgi:uncharacterized protein (DUF1015 family)